MKLVVLLQIAGLLHLGLACAGAAMPRAVQLGTHLAPLPPFIRRLVWVYFTFIAMCLAGFGMLTFFFADTLASGQPLGRALCLFLAVFWFARLLVAAFIFDVRPYLNQPFYRWGYRAMNVVFLYLPLVYGWAAWTGGLR